MKWYEKLTCEELFNTIKTLKAELDNRTLTWDEANHYDNEGIYCMIKTLEFTNYIIYPEIDEVYVCDD